jgi:hypothetical protein
MLYAQAAAPAGVLADDTVRQVITQGLEGRFSGLRLLVLIPDHTRTVPLPQLFRLLTEVLHDARQLDFMVALGTHAALADDALLALVGIVSGCSTTPGTIRQRYRPSARSPRIRSRRLPGRLGIIRLAAMYPCESIKRRLNAIIS